MVNRMDDKLNLNPKTDDIYQSDGFEEIERLSGEESELSEEEKVEKKQKDKAGPQSTSTVIITNSNTNFNTTANKRNISNKFEEGIQTKDKSKPYNTIYLSKEDPQLVLETITFQAELNRLREENGFMKIEKDKIVKIKDNEIAILQEKLAKVQQNLLQLKKEIEQLIHQISENKSKVDNYDNTIIQLKTTTNHNEKFKSNIESHMKVVEALKQERLSLVSKLEAFKAENMTMRQEKMYLLKKTMTQSELIKSLTSKNESNDKEITELKEDRTKLINKLTSKDIEVERVFRSVLERENIKNKEKHNKEINELKESLNQLLINKTKYISDHCDELQHRIYSHKKSLKEKTDQVDFLALELNNKKRINEEENDHLKLQLKIQSEDVNRLTTLYNESLQLVELNQKEICQLKEKYEVIRNQLINKELEGRKEITSYKSKWINEREKNEDYVQLESELDKVICDSALISTADEHSLDLMKRLNALPLNNKKRISQCIILANKVKYLIIDNENLKNTINLLMIENDKVKDEKNAFESVANKIKEPYEFLIIKLEEKEKKNILLQKMINEKDKTITAVIQENKRLEEKAKQIENDLKTVLVNRKQLKNLECIVEEHIQENKNKWELIEWQKQQYELMNQKQTNRNEISTHLKLSNWSNQATK